MINLHLYLQVMGFITDLPTHCKAGPHRIGIHSTSKGMNRYLLRTQRSKSDKLTSKIEVSNSVLGNMCVCFIYVKYLEVWKSVVHLRISVEGTTNLKLEILNDCVMCSVCRRGGYVQTPVFKGGRGDRQMRQKVRELALIGIQTSSARG